MWSTRSLAACSLAALLAAAPALPGQRPGGMTGGMGMMHDSATMGVMQVIHQLVVNHDRIARTVTNLPDGIRTVTQSEDSAMVRLIQRHVAGTVEQAPPAQVGRMPMASDALRTILANRDKVRTKVEVGPKSVTVTQTSDDPAIVAALQQHAAEVTRLVREGMTAMRGPAWQRIH